jgi:hypothetical protein
MMNTEMKKSQSGEVTFPENPMYRGGVLKIVLFRISSLTMTNVFQYASGCTDPTDHPPLTSLTLPHLSSLPLPPQTTRVLVEPVTSAHDDVLLFFWTRGRENSVRVDPNTRNSDHRSSRPSPVTCNVTGVSCCEEYQ